MANSGTSTSPSSTQQLSAAVDALHNSTSAPQREAANAWLMQFVNSDAAWEAGLALLDPAHGGQLQFFGANMVLVKTRNAWSHLSAENQAHMITAISTAFQGLLTTPRTELVVMQRVSLAFSAIAARSGPDAAQAFAVQAVKLAQDSCSSGDLAVMRTAFDLLSSIAEEVETQLGPKQRQVPSAALMTRADEVLQVMGAALPLALSAPGGAQAATAAIKCFQAWLGLDASEGGRALVSPGELLASHRQLFDALLAAAGSSNPVLLQELGDTLSMLYGSGKFGEDRAAEEHALKAGAQGLLRQRSRITQPHGEPLARALASTATALAERSPEALAGSIEEAVPLADLMLQCLSRPEDSVADAVLEYVNCLDYVAMADRNPALQAPFYSRLLPLLLQHAAFPDDFTNWEECVSVDEEAFDRFREHSLSEELETAYNVLRSEFLISCGKSLAEATTWQAAEAALLAIRMASEDAVERALEEEDQEPRSQRDKAATVQFLQQLFGALAAEGDGGLPFRRNPHVAAAAARLLGAYSPWFARSPGAPLEGVLKLLLQTLAFPEAWSPTARAFRTLCVSCKQQLRSAATLMSLAPAVDAAVSATAAGGQSSMAVEDRQLLAEGLARLAAGLPTPEAANVGMTIISPCLQRLQQLMRHPGEPPPSVVSAAAEEVMILSTVFRHLELAGQGAEAHPAMQLLQAAYPSLDALLQLQSWRSHADVVSAVCSVYRYVMLSIKHGAAGLLPTLVTSLDLVFQATHFPAALTALAAATELIAEAQDARTALQSAFMSSSTIISRVFQEQQVSDQQETVAAYLDLADGLLRYAPDMLLPLEQLPVLVAWAAAALRVRESAPVKAASALLHHLVSPAKAGVDTSPGFQAHQARVQQCVGQQGASLVQALLLALCDTCPRPLLRPLAALLHALLTSSAYREPAPTWLQAALRSGELQGVIQHHATTEDCSQFYNIATRATPQLPFARFVSLITDFANIARGEGTGDILLSYEL